MVHRPPTTYVTKAVVNIGNTPLGNITHLALLKGLNFTVFPSVLPTEDILCDNENTISTMMVEATEEV
jgi:hypothetical protein